MSRWKIGGSAKGTYLIRAPGRRERPGVEGLGSEWHCSLVYRKRFGKRFENLATELEQISWYHMFGILMDKKIKVGCGFLWQADRTELKEQSISKKLA